MSTKTLSLSQIYLKNSGKNYRKNYLFLPMRSMFYTVSENILLTTIATHFGQNRALKTRFLSPFKL